MRHINAANLAWGELIAPLKPAIVYVGRGDDPGESVLVYVVHTRDDIIDCLHFPATRKAAEDYKRRTGTPIALLHTYASLFVHGRDYFENGIIRPYNCEVLYDNGMLSYYADPKLDRYFLKRVSTPDVPQNLQRALRSFYNHGR